MDHALSLLLACTLAAADGPDGDPARPKANASKPAPVADPFYTP